MENVIKGYPEVPQSITNNNVLDANALDRNQAETKHKAHGSGNTSVSYEIHTHTHTTFCCLPH